MNARLFTFHVRKLREKVFNVTYSPLSEDHDPAELAAAFPNVCLISPRQTNDEDTTAFVLKRIQEEVDRTSALIEAGEEAWSDNYYETYHDTIATDPYRVFAHFFLASRKNIDPNLTYLFFRHQVPISLDAFTDKKQPIIVGNNPIIEVTLPPYYFILYPREQVTDEVKGYFNMVVNQHFKESATWN